MTTLATAIECKQWDFVALCLLIGVAEVAATLPPEALDQLLDLLELDAHASSNDLPSPLRRGARDEGSQPARASGAVRRSSQ